MLLYRVQKYIQVNYHVSDFINLCITDESTNIYDLAHVDGILILFILNWVSEKKNLVEQTKQIFYSMVKS